MKKYLFFIVLFVSFTIGLFGEIINVPGDFPTIQLAINEALSLTGYVTIEVEEDIYIENLDIDLDSTGLSHLTLVGVDGAESCIINGGNVGNIVDVYYSLYTDKFFKITGFTIKNSITSKGIYAHSGPWVSSALNVEISNNIIQDSRCGIDLYRVSNCVVNDNTIINYSQVEPSWGIKSGYVNNVIINGNFVSNFWDNITFLSSDGKIINNKIDIITYSGESYGISLQASSNIDIIDNLILVNSGETGIYNSSEGNNAKIINNTIIGFGDNTVGYRVYLWGNTEKFVNNIMWNLDHNIYAGETVFEVNYCCYNGTIPPECEPLENHNIYTDPLFTTDYHLSENSPCINAGDPDTDGDGLDWIYDEDDRDIDGSRKDMGCHPFLHNYDTKHFDVGVHWVSFPVLTQHGVYTSPPQPSIPPINNQIFEQAYYENGMSGLLQETSGTTGTINEFVNILGKRYGVDMEIYPEGSNYIGNDFGFDNMLFRHEGYKIVVGEVTNPTTLLVGDEVEDERLCNRRINESWRISLARLLASLSTKYGRCFWFWNSG